MVRSVSLPVLAILFAMLIVAAPVPRADAAPTDGTEAASVQSIQLRKGWNIVSLTVRPGNLAISQVLASILDSVEQVEDDKGSLYAPGKSGGGLTQWDPAKAYRIRVSRDVTLTVTGKPLETNEVRMGIRAGWNLVPYYLDRGQKVGDAFSQLGDDLVLVKGSDGRIYYPDAEIFDLDELQPGEGYDVLTTRNAELRIRPKGSAPRPTGNATYTVNTMAEALALRGLKPGETIEVMGYHRAGDGGYGFFDVAQSNCVPDGGTCFVPVEHQSAEVRQVMQVTDSKQFLGGKPLVQGSVRLEIHDSNGKHAITIPGEYLHGHRGSQQYSPRPFLDLTEASFHDFRRFIRNHINGYLGGGSYAFFYRQATSDVRLVRQGVTDTYNVRWFGAQRVDENPNYDIQPLIANLVNFGKLRGMITTILIPDTGVYEYYGGIELEDGMTLRGAGGTYLATDTDEFGNTFRPVRILRDHTRLRVKDDMALAFLRMMLPQNDVHHLVPNAKHILGNSRTLISSANNVTYMGLEDLVLDGNWEQNSEIFGNRDKYGGSSIMKPYLQDSPSYSGFVSTDHGGNIIPLGQEVVVRNVAITGYAATGVLGNINNLWFGENVLLANTAWNHVLYGASGEWVNLTLTGFSWTHATPSRGIVTNLVFENGTRNPFRPASDLINVRGPDAYDRSEVRDVRLPDASLPGLGFTVRGFYIDLRGSGISQPFNGLGSYHRIADGVLIADAGYVATFHENGNGYQSGLYKENNFRNIEVIETGNASGRILGSNNLTLSAVKDIRVRRESAAGNGGWSFSMNAGSRTSESHHGRFTFLIENIHDESERHFIFRSAIAEDSPGRDVYVRNSSFNNQTNGLIVGSNNQGRLTSITEDHSLLTYYFDNVEFNFGFSSSRTNLELILSLSRFRNVYARNLDRYSEDKGAVSHTATGTEAFLDVDTRLFWEPEYINVTGPSQKLVARVETVNVEGLNRTEPVLRIHFVRSLKRGEKVELQWEAAVRPFPKDFNGSTFEDLATAVAL